VFDGKTQLDAIAAAFSSSTYINGTSRSSGWTFTKQTTGGNTVALAGVPATSSIGQKVVLASATAQGSAVLYAGESWGATPIWGSISKNAGAFTSWNNANPFTTGNFLGYMPFASATAVNSTVGATSVIIRCYESQDAIAIIHRYSNGIVQGCFMGGFIDPESLSSADSETDGLLYGMSTAGTSNSIPGNAISTSTHGDPSGLFDHSSTAARSHTAVFTPGSGTSRSLNKIMRVAPSSTSLLTNSGKIVKVPIYMSEGDSFFAGRLREIWMVRDGQHGNTVRDGANEVGHLVGGSTTTVSDVYLLSV
jgi:hypothetical protein